VAGVARYSGPRWTRKRRVLCAIVQPTAIAAIGTATPLLFAATKASQSAEINGIGGEGIPSQYPTGTGLLPIFSP
jgi:hypothetical protein